MSKMGLHDPFRHSEHKLWPKKRLCQFDPRPLKVRNRFDFLACRWDATYLWKALNEGYNVAFEPHLNRRFTHKVMGLQSYGSPNFGNLGTK
jgi:hypothetical protein